MRNVITTALTGVAVLIFLLVVLTTALQAKPAPVINKDRVVVINGPIDSDVLKGPVEALNRHGKSKGPIDIVISSPGGEMIAGLLFINLLEGVKARGNKIRCFVPTVAASMAFQILLHCDERYALSYAFLLWHRVRIVVGGFGGEVITAPLARDLAHALQQLDNIVLRKLYATLDMPQATINYHFEQETLHVAAALERSAPKFIQVYDAIDGLMDVMEEADQVESTVEPSSHETGTILY